MIDNKKHHEPREYLAAAENSILLAKTLAGFVTEIDDRSFLERMARSDVLVDHDGTTCGICYQMILGAEVAREMVKAGDFDDSKNKWAAENHRRWIDSKFYKLWQAEVAAGRDPHAAFTAKGWEP